MKSSALKFGSLCVREIKEIRSTKSHVLPIHPTSSFVFDDIDQGIRMFQGEEKGHVYSRFGNPTVDTVAEKLAQLETHGLDVNGSGILFSSGMSAILTLMLATLQSGDKILSQANLYGGTTEQFNKILYTHGITPVFTNLRDLELVEKHLKEDKTIRMIYAESPANPTLACINLGAMASLAKQFEVWTAVDNTFMTPYLQQPIRHGIDFVVHSTTKFLNGHGNSTAGVLISKHQELMQKDIWRTMKLAGTNCNAWDAWLIHNGLKTLTLRMDRHCQNALEVASFLAQHPKVSQVNYPGLPSHPDHVLAQQQMQQFGGMLSFEVRGGLDHALSCLRRLQLCTLAPTLGDVDTLVLHPVTSSHINIDPETRAREGITDGLIRVSVGIEDVDDIKNDLAQALA